MNIILLRHIWAIPLIANCYYTMRVCDWCVLWIEWRYLYCSFTVENWILNWAAISNWFENHAELDLPMVYQMLSYRSFGIHEYVCMCVSLRSKQIFKPTHLHSEYYTNLWSHSLTLWFFTDEFISKSQWKKKWELKPNCVWINRSLCLQHQ